MKKLLLAVVLILGGIIGVTLALAVVGLIFAGAVVVETAVLNAFSLLVNVR